MRNCWVKKPSDLAVIDMCGFFDYDPNHSWDHSSDSQSELIGLNDEDHQVQGSWTMSPSEES